MRSQHWVYLIAVASTVGVAAIAWFKLLNPSLVGAAAVCWFNIVIWSLGLPYKKLVEIESVRNTLDAKVDEEIELKPNCRKCEKDRASYQGAHLHFSELLELTTGEALAHSYGAAKVSDDAIQHIRYKPLFGIVGAVALFLLLLLRDGSTGSTNPGIENGGSVQEMIFVIIVGLIPFLQSVNTIILFRKHNESIMLKLNTAF